MSQLGLFDRPAECGAAYEELRCTRELEHLGIHYDRRARANFTRPAWRRGDTGELVDLTGDDE